MAYLYILAFSTIHRYTIYIREIIIPNIDTPFSTFLFSLSIHAVKNKYVKNSAKKPNLQSAYTFICNKSILINTNNARKLAPENTSKAKYLGLIFCLQYLHFPPKKI